jgi:glycosyltransferase involved in cell wall biosynthesis
MFNSQPLVSILIPLFNSEKYILKTLKSCTNQIYANIEIIIVDDGSTDASLSMVQNYANNYEYIRVYQQKNSGACKARNLAFEKCHGDYVMYLDADDVLSPNYVSEHLAFLASSGCESVSFCPWDRFYSNLEEAKFPSLNIYKHYEDTFQLLLDMWNDGSMLQTSCYMVPRQLVEKSGGWDETVLKNQDGEFFSRILMQAKKAYFVPEAKVYYRSGNYLSVSKAASKEKVASMLDTFISYRKNALAKENSERVRKALAVNFTLFMYIHGNQFPDLMDKARKEVKGLGVGYQLNTQPTRVQQICKCIGFDTFLWLRKHLLQR